MSGSLDAAHDADLLLCEASWQDADGLPANLHLTARQAASHADKAGVDRLLLTHLLPWLRPEVSVEQAAAAFAGPAGAGHHRRDLRGVRTKRRGAT